MVQYVTLKEKNIGPDEIVWISQSCFYSKLPDNSYYSYAIESTNGEFTLILYKSGSGYTECLPFFRKGNRKNPKEQRQYNFWGGNISINDEKNELWFDSNIYKIFWINKNEDSRSFYWNVDNYFSWLFILNSETGIYHCIKCESSQFTTLKL